MPEDDVLGRGDERRAGARSRRSPRRRRRSRTAVGRRVAAASAQDRQRLRSPRLAQRRHGLQPHRLGVPRHRQQRWPRAPRASACLTAASCSPASACSSAGSAPASRERNTASPLQPRAPGRGSQGQAADGGLDSAPDAVVDPHRLQRGGDRRPAARRRRSQRRAGCRRPVLMKAGCWAGWTQQVAVGEGVEDRRRPRAAAGGERRRCRPRCRRTWSTRACASASSSRLRAAPARPRPARQNRTASRHGACAVGISRGNGGRRRRVGRLRPGSSRRLRRQLPPVPPHLPVLTLKLPHDSGARQSEIRSFEPGR